jgi:hypothetical protein
VRRQLGRRPRVTATVRIDAYEVIARAVEAGVADGLNHGQKYWPKRLKPETQAHLEEEICRAVRGELCEVLKLDDQPQ